MNVDECKIEILLYSTLGCHLCEQAADLIHPCGAVVLKIVEIADDPELLARYGLRIPVARCATGQELDWPFDAAAFERWLAR
ncbi:MAG: glutaredoxin family protein [Candidatus Competibacter sp.]